MGVTTIQRIKEIRSQQSIKGSSMHFCAVDKKSCPNYSDIQSITLISNHISSNTSQINMLQVIY